jgi:hypothetical protein
MDYRGYARPQKWKGSKEMMTRKHFIDIAQIFRSALQRHAVNIDAKLALTEVAFELADFCAGENPNFDYDKFLRAAGVRGEDAIK